MHVRKGEPHWPAGGHAGLRSESKEGMGDGCRRKDTGGI